MVQFRVKALNQLQKPDDLDLLMKVTKMRGWVALATLAAVIVGALVWSFVGSLPSQVTAPGLLSKPQGVSMIESTVEGQILSLKVAENADIKPGAAIATVRLLTARRRRSHWGGDITGVPVDVGNYVTPGRR